jgi:hypothetical protein
MPGRVPQLSCGVTSLVIALGLPACGADSGTPHQSSTSQPTTTTTTAIAAPPPIPGPRTEKWIDLDVGDCLTGVPQVDLGEVDVTRVDCTTPHMAEVYFRGPLTVNEAIPDVANSQCSAQFVAYTGLSFVGSRFAVTFLVDSNQDRTTIEPTTGPAPSTVICLLQDAHGQPLTGSARR